MIRFPAVFMLLSEIFSALVSVERMKEMEATSIQTGKSVCANQGYEDLSFGMLYFLIRKKRMQKKYYQEFPS